MQKILIANRGEIAVRIARACRELDLSPVAVYSECDRAAPHVQAADEAYYLGPSAASASYLSIDAILAAARRSRADAVHPGYGFLAENAAFAAAVRRAGLTFIGPTPEAMALMGSKTAARAAASRAGVPVVPGTSEPIAADAPPAEIERLAAAIGYPLLVKAVAGGGGKGMRAVSAAADLLDAVAAARSEARSAFGDPSVYFERRLARPRHVEVQILADDHGAIVPFVERECSIQRRHQKVLEESPSPAVPAALREALAAAAVGVARAAGYTNAGTVEFLVDEDGRFYFLEMNTRLQVEHPVTEMVTGVDLVQWQIRIARGERLDLDPARMLVPHGHAIECRINAEDPDNGFLPSPGRISWLRPPAGPGVRDDSGVAEGFEVPIFYDSLVSKVIAWAEDRPRAIARMRRAVAEYRLVGVPTTLPFFRWLLDRPEFVAGRYDTGYLDTVLRAPDARPVAEPPPEAADLAAAATVLQALIEGGAAAGPREGAPDRPASRGGWKAQARAEAVRP